MIDFTVFRGKRVLVTGHTGFKGSWLTKTLELAGAKIYGLSLRPEERSHYQQLDLEVHNPETEFTDIRNFEAVRNCLQEADPELVFHLAAQPLVLESMRKPRETFETNVMGGVNLLEGLRLEATALRGLVFITSDKAYENLEWEWGYRETDRLGGFDPYSGSKGAVEIVVSSYSRALMRGFPIVTARAGNVIGGGDWSENRVVPDIMRALESGKPVILRNPNSTRPWQHVLEPLSGYLRLAEMMISDVGPRENAYNFGPSLDRARTVRDLVDALVSSFGKGEVRIESTPGFDHEAVLLQLNCDRAREELRWMPRWDFHQTVEKTGHWYMELAKGKPVNTITEDQIFEYFSELEK